ncbi:MAG: DMT family transporter [Pseudomonadota bacterium]
MNERLGIVLMLIAMLSFSISDAFIKASEGHISLGQSLFWLGILGTMCFALYARLLGQNPFPRSLLEPPVLFRGASEILATGSIFTALLYGSLTKTISIHQIQPILVTLGATLYFKEQIGWRRWTAIIVGFASVMLIIRPGFSGWDYTVIFALMGAVGLALRDLSTKAIGSHVSSVQLSVLGYLALIPLGAVVLAIEDADLWIGWENAHLIAGITLFSMIAYLTITQSVRVAEFGAVMPFRFSRLIFVYAIGVFWFGEILDWQTIVGAMGILFAGLFVLIRSDKLSNSAGVQK